MDDKILFKRCVREAIDLGRPYMKRYEFEDEPTNQEWNLALIIFQYELNKKLNEGG